MEICKQLDIQLDVQTNFDIVKRQLQSNGCTYTLYFIDGFVKDEVMEKMMEFFLTKVDLKNKSIEEVSQSFVPYVEVEIKKTIAQMIDAILAGSVILHIEGYQDTICIDARTYPVRSMHEPEDDRVLRGSRDGFVETIIFNTAMIRRRIRDPRLKMEHQCIGSKSKTDVVLCYLDGVVDKQIVSRVKQRIQSVKVESLTMSQESIAELFVEGKWYSPFPKVRYSERPDVATSNILEGKLIVIVDNTPSVLILPTYFFDFVQEAQDYYMPPTIGTYLRIIRIGVFLTTLLITPVWYYLNENPELVPNWLQFILLKDTTNVPLLVQFFLLEFAIDALKLASLNTPSALSGSFSILGALLLGDFAVKSGWFNAEVILYMAYVALANFTQPSYELGYAVKFMRMMLLLFVFALPGIGLYLGIGLMVIILYRSKTISKQSYLYPLLPFNYHDFKNIFVRTKLTKK